MDKYIKEREIINERRKERKLLKEDIEKKKNRIEELNQEISELMFRYNI